MAETINLFISEPFQEVADKSTTGTDWLPLVDKSARWHPDRTVPCTDKCTPATNGGTEESKRRGQNVADLSCRTGDKAGCLHK
ncbi:hypothetical protein GCM10023318_12040 [Nocardia callitridis]|uniref:Uncharacterized protein n=1 Tax=Nocardia callitridis TaxID=648753 RepID=A0ABP9JZW5_9NOCA